MLSHYLEGYAEAEVQLLSNCPTLRYGKVLVIPAFGENPAFLQRLFARQQDFLVVLVINQPEGSEDNAANQQLAQSLAEHNSPVWQSANVQLYQCAYNPVLVVDRFAVGNQIPVKQGVGLARKIGCDIATFLYHRGDTASPWIFTTDADAHLPADYFQLPERKGYTAAVMPFKHRCDDSVVGRATALYEHAIRYYARGLAWAGSAYGFTTLGSALAIDVVAYAKVRGFPKRAGGEDFYLLNKLAKLGPVLAATITPIELEARISDRVPFGTGPAVNTITALASIDDYCYYAPAVFQRLKFWLNAANQPQAWSSETFLQQLPEDIQYGLHAIDITSFQEHIRRQRMDSAKILKAFCDWFDAFRTLKFIRHLQSRYYPALPLQECLHNGDF